MYIEYVIIFICLGIIIALLVAAVAMLAVLMKSRNNNVPVYNRNNSPARSDKKETAPPATKVVFCRHCAAQFDATQKVCPSCGAQR